LRGGKPMKSKRATPARQPKPRSASGKKRG
jgi:hypothetical protein